MNRRRDFVHFRCLQKLCQPLAAFKVTIRGQNDAVAYTLGRMKNCAQVIPHRRLSARDIQAVQRSAFPSVSFQRCLDSIHGRQDLIAPVRFHAFHAKQTVMIANPVQPIQIFSDVNHSRPHVSPHKKERIARLFHTIRLIRFAAVSLASASMARRASATRYCFFDIRLHDRKNEVVLLTGAQYGLVVLFHGRFLLSLYFL